jgi:DNA-binding transcriptional ArsR family regulator
MSKLSYVSLFSALGNKTRLNILIALRYGEKNVSKITEELGYDQTTVSHSLQKLAASGLVKSAKKGKERVYSVTETTLRLLKAAEHAKEKD